jgi:hypothetical protein
MLGSKFLAVYELDGKQSPAKLIIKNMIIVSSILGAVILTKASKTLR